jgi:hypothetical protein
MKRLIVMVGTLLTFAGVSAVTAIPSSASVCQPDGNGCTKAGAYPGPNAVISNNYTGFKVVWTESAVQPYSSGVPLYWTAYITYTNITSHTLTLGCPGNWANASFVSEHMSGGSGDDGTVSAESTSCSQKPRLAVRVAPGGTSIFSAIFHNVPWPGSAVAITWGSAGTSRNVYPFASGPSSPLKGNNAWNGYLQAGGYDNTALGDWTVPRDTCKAADNGATSAPWIGLGGLPVGGTFSPLVQIGTWTQCQVKNGKAVEIARPVYQVIQAQPGQLDIPGYNDTGEVFGSQAISPGDSISAAIEWDPNNGTYYLSLTDTTRHSPPWNVTFATTLNRNTPVSAEWIMESGVNLFGTVAPLANFGTFKFTHMFFEKNRTDYGPLTNAGTYLLYQVPRKVIIYPVNLTGSAPNWNPIGKLQYAG